VWWVCDKGHEWEAKICNRKRTGCPYCAGKKISSDNNLTFINPTLAKQWHPTKNGDLSPDIVTPGSNKKAWWICDKGHEWEAVINSRKTCGCPYCSGQKASDKNNLATIYPSISKQWHPTKNGDISPDMVTPGSGKKVWWICGKGHEWEAVIKSRRTNGCPYCSGRRATDNNNFAALYPEAAKQWHPTKNGDISPDMVTPCSNKKVWWVCNKGHEWEAVICNRTTPKQPTGCPHCSRRKS
jgi:hypothetical protein